MAGVEGALQCFWTFVDQCKTGTRAELWLSCEGGHVKVNMCADLGPLGPKLALQVVTLVMGVCPKSAQVKTGEGRGGQLRELLL